MNIKLLYFLFIIKIILQFFKKETNYILFYRFLLHSLLVIDYVIFMAEIGNVFKNIGLCLLLREVLFKMTFIIV